MKILSLAKNIKGAEMAIDFKNRKPVYEGQPITNPIEIFRRLPKPPGINDLYASQNDVLGQWEERKMEQDLVIKLHTGGGKTLVGLLIAKSLLNETKQPVIYLCPTNQLVEQTLEKAKQYNIEAYTPISGQSTLPVDCMNAKAVFICTYDKMFNGLSMFGIHGSGKPPIAIGGIVVDDAHVSFSTLRDKFTLNIDRETNGELYKHITTLFKPDFDEIKRLSSYEDIINGRDKGNVVEVPYWAWEHKKEEVKKAIVNAMSEGLEFRFVWPLIRDDLSACHCLVYDKSVSIVPILPLMDKVPSFADCKRRIFMSATIADDSCQASQKSDHLRHIKLTI